MIIGMTRSSPLLAKSYPFALAIIHFCIGLDRQHAYVLSKQLLKSGTSIGANIEEAMRGQSTNDFIAKLSISLKEAAETHYWLRLIRDTSIVPVTDCERLLAQADELIRLLVASIKTAKSR